MNKTGIYLLILMIVGSLCIKAFNLHDYCELEKSCTMEFSFNDINSQSAHADHSCPVHGSHGCASFGAIDKPTSFRWDNLSLAAVFLEKLDSIKPSPFLSTPEEPPRT